MPDVMRVRNAPSPTGPVHLGSVRNALYNWLLARGSGGTYVLRIEDTDRARSTPEYERMLLDAYRWVGLDWDEGPDAGGPYGPYRQSERGESHAAAVRRIVSEGLGYRCYCTPEELAAERAAAGGQAYVYSGRCRGLSEAQRTAFENEGRDHTIRFAVRPNEEVVIEDLVRGEVRFNTSHFGDFIVARSDGTAIFLLANLVDDHEMRITHVVRGEDHLSNTPRQVLMARALGWPVPRYGHLPLVLDTSRRKLSKRHAQTDLAAYRDEGYLPEAMVNFLAFLGWSPGSEEEVFTLEELVRRFSIERVSKAGAIFNIERLNWLNGHYLRAMSTAAFASRMGPFLPASAAHDVVELAAPLVQERARTLREAADMLGFLWERPVPAAESLAARGDAGAAAAALIDVAEVLRSSGSVDPAQLEPALRALAEQAGVRFKDLMMTLRVAITGRTVSPPLLESMAILGLGECVARIESALTELTAQPDPTP